MKRDRFRSICLVAIVAGGLPLLAVGDPAAELDDAAARLQYAYFTADIRGVQDAAALVQRLELPSSLQGMKEYYAAYAAWKLAELHADRVAAGQRDARGEQTKSARACEDAADAATRAAPRMAEAHAMKAICAALTQRSAENRSLAACARHKDLRTAKELAPDNVRVRLIEAQCRADSEAPAEAIQRLQRLARNFGEAAPSSPGRPDWGEAEAWLLLGRLQRQQGEAVGARNALERALVIASDYVKAKEELRLLAAGSRN